MNISLLGKLTWSLLHDPTKLWVQVLSHKYLRNKIVFEDSYSASSSSISKVNLPGAFFFRQGGAGFWGRGMGWVRGLRDRIYSLSNKAAQCAIKPMPRSKIFQEP